MPLTALRAAPAALPCAAALAVLGWWAADAGGFEVRLWAPGGLALVALLVVAALWAPGVRGAPRLVLVAAAALAAYTAWSFASIGWADDPGAAFEGATRTLLYLVVFALFALFPQRGSTGAALLGLWVATLGAVGLVLGLRLAASEDLAELFYFDRLSSPTGYTNATAALLVLPVFPAVVLAASRSVPWWGRAVAAGIATGLPCLALLTVSRGAVFSVPIVAVLFFLLVPDRVRHFYALLVPALGVAACAPRLLDVADVVEGAGGAAVLGDALGRVVLAVAVAVVVVAAWALLERRTAARPAAGGRALPAILRTVPVVLVAAGLVAGVVAVGDPVDRADAAWESFKGGYEDNDAEANRLLGGLGSARYDFYRVSLRAFADEPLTGVGADGFFQQYLLEGASAETPRYPHSLQMRTLAQTGAVGAVLLLVAFGAALVAALRAMRLGSGLRRAAAAGATMAWVYWLVHGSVDWFWEWAGLGAPAFALLGLACALARRPAAAGAAVAPPRSRGPLRAVLVVAAGLVAAVPFAVLWAADDRQRRAAEVFATDPLTAYDELDRAAGINPFSAAPDALAGSIALRWGDLRRADAAFARALERVPDEQYALLERGAIASALGRRAVARRFLDRAVALAPRDPFARDARRIVRRGRTIDVAELNRRIRAANARFAP